MGPAYGLAAVEWPLVVCEELLFGTAAFALVVAPGDAAACDALARGFRALWLTLALGALAVSPIALLAQVAQMADVSIVHAFGFVHEALTSTHAGRLWIWRLVALVALVAAVRPRLPVRRTARRLLVLGACVLLIGALSSHAIDHGEVSAALYVVHEIAAGLWFGAVAGLLLAMRTAPDEPWIADTVRRVSKVAGWSVCILVASGALVAWRTLNVSERNIIHSEYGCVLLLKIAILAIALVIAFHNRRRLVPAANRPVARGLLMRNVGAECLLLLCALAAACLLANTPMWH